ncbi:hypothetical protein BDB01DRAFT_855175 [Pilobolus umbonatus]|nr:hypothetical protein BDB01DRAFT_855175 [Pilobolus umbonatus]
MSDWMLLYNQSDILLVIKKSASISSPVPVPLPPSSTGYLMYDMYFTPCHNINFPFLIGVLSSVTNYIYLLSNQVATLSNFSLFETDNHE